ncbi:MAG: hypothetical protein ICV87_06785 [Gemmatimonadetes bacterium]|nr:hypothetical protein [Gemmatimonadota bacterium]
MDSALFRALCAALLPLLLAVPPLAAQAADSIPPDSARPAVLHSVGSGEEDRERVLQLLGRAPDAGFLIRSPSSRARPGRGFALLRPEGRIVYNSGLPYSLNEGTLWAGRGAGVLVTGGFRARLGRLRLTVAPEVAGSANRDFQTLTPFGEYSRFASPFHVRRYTADLPLRFGEGSDVTVSLGQSSAVLELGRLEAGAATESQWWGPGIRNALVMSNNAPGFPHLFARTGRPLRTPAGDFEARWVAGALHESGYFDQRSGNDVRSLSAAAVAWRPVWEPNLTLGATLAVVAEAGSTAAAPLHALDVLVPAGGDRERLSSLFARWIFPASGVEVYAEGPGAYTLGLQWARPTSATGIVRVQAEVSDLESVRGGGVGFDVHSYYTSRKVAQGVTNRGRALGASIGPGASSQWLAVDHLGERWEAGAFAGRVRWENDALYATFEPSLVAHDVTALLGVRGALRAGGFRIGAELTAGKRYNYLFQVARPEFEGSGAVNIPNQTLRLTVEPLRR